MLTDTVLQKENNDVYVNKLDILTQVDYNSISVSTCYNGENALNLAWVVVLLVVV